MSLLTYDIKFQEVSTICFLNYNYTHFFLLPPMMMMTMVKSKVIMIIRRRVNQCHYRLLNWGPGRLYQIHIQTASFPKISLSKHIDFEMFGSCFVHRVWNCYDQVCQIVCNFCNWLYHMSFNTFNTMKLQQKFQMTNQSLHLKCTHTTKGHTKCLQIFNMYRKNILFCMYH